MTSPAIPKARYERAQASDGRTYLVCAVMTCRRLLLPGKSSNPCHPIAQPGLASPDATKQATCGPCYLTTFRTIYPFSPLPKVEDGYVPNEEPVPWGKNAAAEPGIEDDYTQWQNAMEASKASNGAETVADAHRRMYGSGSKPDVEITMPPSPAPEDKPAAEGGPAVGAGVPHECDDGPNPLDETPEGGYRE